MTPPPRSASLQADAGSGDLRVRLFASARGDLDLRFDRGEGTFDPAEVRVHARHEVASIGPLERRAVRAAPGVYRVDDLVLRVPGTWIVVVTARIDDFTQREFELAVSVPFPRDRDGANAAPPPRIRD